MNQVHMSFNTPVGGTVQFEAVNEVCDVPQGQWTHGTITLSGTNNIPESFVCTTQAKVSLENTRADRIIKKEQDIALMYQAG